MPGANARALEKSRTLPADALIFDLEDAVAPDAKQNARTQVVQAVETGGYEKREIFIRTNGLNTPWGYDDLVAAAKAGPDAVLLPKVESAETVRQAESVLLSHGAPPEMAIWCMMETPRAMLHAEEIADASPRLGGLVMGTSDLAKDLQAQHTAMRLPLITALGLCILAARAARIAILDGVYLDLNDHEGFVDSCRQGAELGFDGKTLIHPKQLAAGKRGVRTLRRGAQAFPTHHRRLCRGRSRGQGRGPGGWQAHREAARRPCQACGRAGRGDRGVDSNEKNG